MKNTETKQCPYCKMDIAPMDRHGHEAVPEQMDLTVLRVTCILQRIYRIGANRASTVIDSGHGR